MKPGPGDLGLADQIARWNGVHDRLRELTRVASRRFCELQRDVRREVPVRRVARALDVDDRAHDVCGQYVGRQRRKRGLDETFELIFHESVSMQKRGGILAVRRLTSSATMTGRPRAGKPIGRTDQESPFPACRRFSCRMLSRLPTSLPCPRLSSSEQFGRIHIDRPAHALAPPAAFPRPRASLLRNFCSGECEAACSRSCARWRPARRSMGAGAGPSSLRSRLEWR